jgi:hypothetical protein
MGLRSVLWMILNCEREVIYPAIWKHRQGPIEQSQGAWLDADISDLDLHAYLHVIFLSGKGDRPRR